MLIILAGLPGVGKTTIARALARTLDAVHVRIDSIEQAIRDSGIGTAIDDAGYRVAYAVAEDNLRLGRVVIADSVNPLPLTRDAWRDVARRACTDAVEIEIICSNPQEHRRRVETRTADVAGLKLPTWAEVLARDYCRWDRDRIVIDTAHAATDACLETLRAALELTQAGETSAVGRLSSAHQRRDWRQHSPANVMDETRSIRKAAIDDAAGILECLRAAFEPYEPRYTPDAYRDTVLTSDTLRERLACMSIFVAVTPRGEVIGTIACQVTGSDEGHLRGMAIVPHCQGSGIADALLAAAEQELRQSHCSRVTLDTVEPLQRAIRFYERHGYRPSGRARDFFGMPLYEYVKTLR
jgi:predicted kinase/ribosomal protein S18 acetylase RimI-like enzyme